MLIPSMQGPTGHNSVEAFRNTEQPAGRRPFTSILDSLKSQADNLAETQKSDAEADPADEKPKNSPEQPIGTPVFLPAVAWPTPAIPTGSGQELTTPATGDFATATQPPATDQASLPAATGPTDLVAQATQASPGSGLALAAPTPAGNPVLTGLTETAETAGPDAHTPAAAPGGTSAHPDMRPASKEPSPTPASAAGAPERTAPTPASQDSAFKVYRMDQTDVAVLSIATEEHGPVRIKVRVRENGAEIAMTSASGELRDRMQAALPDLMASMQGSGFQVGSAVISHDDRPRQEQGRGGNPASSYPQGGSTEAAPTRVRKNIGLVDTFA